MEQIEILSGKDLIKRLNIPPYGLLDDLRYRGKFCPRNKKTGTPIAPPGRQSELKAIKKLEKAVRDLQFNKRKAAIELGLEAVRGIPKIDRQAYGRLKGAKADLDFFRSQLALLIHQVGYPFRMWECYYPADEEEKGRAIDILLDSHFWVRFAEGAIPALEAQIAAYDADPSRQPPDAIDYEAAKHKERPGHDKQPLGPAQAAVRQYQTRYHAERLSVEQFCDAQLKKKPKPSPAATLRGAKKKLSDKWEHSVPDSTIRKWIARKYQAAEKKINLH
ncbi:MAG: hypothetical protein ABSC04_03035 [Syntrophobacteraceae bacterium]|jgi:hypothetical protein